MKKIKVLSIALLALGMSLTSNAQTEIGKILLGSETKLNFASINSRLETDNDKMDMGKSSEFEFSPQIGFFIDNNIVIGVDVPMMFSTEEYEEDNEKYSSSSIALAPFLRQYFGTTNVKPFLQGEIGFGNMTVSVDPAYGSSEDTSMGMFLYEIGGGIAVFLNEYISLDFELGYASVTLKPKEDNGTGLKSVSSGFGFGVGFALVL